MFEIRTELLEKVRKYLLLVEERGIPVRSAYIFGSFADRKENENSDIDLAIFSEKFQGIRILDREMLIGISRLVDIRISPLPLPTDSDADSLFVSQEVISKGIKVS